MGVQCKVRDFRRPPGASCLDTFFAFVTVGREFEKFSFELIFQISRGTFVPRDVTKRREECPSVGFESETRASEELAWQVVAQIGARAV